MNKALLTTLHRLGLSNSLKRKLMHTLVDYWPAKLEERATWMIQEVGIEPYLQKKGQYLDIGCGAGHVMKIMEQVHPELEMEWMGVDSGDYPTNRVSQQILANRRDKSKPFFIVADATKLPFNDKTRDGVTILFVLHHLRIEDQRKALREAQRVVKKGGYIFIAEDLVDSESQRRITEEADIRSNWERKDEPHNYRSSQEWISIFRELGFKVIKDRSFSSTYAGLAVKHGAFILKKL